MICVWLYIFGAEDSVLSQSSGMDRPSPLSSLMASIPSIHKRNSDGELNVSFEDQTTQSESSSRTSSKTSPVKRYKMKRPTPLCVPVSRSIYSQNFDEINLPKLEDQRFFQYLMDENFLVTRNDLLQPNSIKMRLTLGKLLTKKRWLSYVQKGVSGLGSTSNFLQNGLAIFRLTPELTSNTYMREGVNKIFDQVAGAMGSFGIFATVSSSSIRQSIKRKDDQITKLREVLSDLNQYEKRLSDLVDNYYRCEEIR